MLNKPLFHSVDCTWRSCTGITLTFLPENEADTRSFVAGLIPYIKATHSSWFLKLFSEDSQLQHLNLTWNSTTRQAYSAEEAELDGFLTVNDELNMLEDSGGLDMDALMEHNIKKVANQEQVPTLYNDNYSVSTFHKVTPGSSTISN